MGRYSSVEGSGDRRALIGAMNAKETLMQLLRKNKIVANALPAVMLLTGLVAANTFHAIAAQQPNKDNPAQSPATASQAGRAPTEKERQQMRARVMANPLIAARAKEHKTRIIRLYSGQGDPATTIAKYQQQNITAIVFDYDTNKATRYVLQTNTGLLVSEQVLSGRVQPSDEEIEAATTIIKSDPELAKLLKAGSKVTGGFIVDGPNHSSPDHRFIQMRIVTPDLRRTEKVVLIDLTSDSIVSK